MPVSHRTPVPTQLPINVQGKPAARGPSAWLPVSTWADGGSRHLPLAWHSPRWMRLDETANRISLSLPLPLLTLCLSNKQIFCKIPIFHSSFFIKTMAEKSPFLLFLRQKNTQTSHPLVYSYSWGWPKPKLGIWNLTSNSPWVASFTAFPGT